MGFLKRRRQRQSAQAFDAFLATPDASAEIERFLRAATATAAEELPEEEREFWQAFERRAEAVETAVAEVLPQTEGLTPDARARLLSGLPGKFDVANLLAHRVWKRDIERLNAADFEAAARTVESLTVPSAYHSAKVAFLAAERARRGLAPGVVRERGAAADLQLSEMGANGTGASERVALRIDIGMNFLEDALDGAKPSKGREERSAQEGSDEPGGLNARTSDVAAAVETFVHVRGRRPKTEEDWELVHELAKPSHARSRARMDALAARGVLSEAILEGEQALASLASSLAFLSPQERRSYLNRLTPAQRAIAEVALADVEADEAAHATGS